MNFYALTGQLIREWVKLELFLSLWLTDLLNVDEFRSRLLWNSYGDLRSKLNLLRTLVHNYADDSLWDESRDILARTEKIAEDRFILAHTFGDVDASANHLDFFSEKSAKERIDTADLERWVSEITACQNSIREFKGKLHNRVHEKSSVQRRPL
jgi:hypothetical protein